MGSLNQVFLKNSDEVFELGLHQNVKHLFGKNTSPL